MSTYVAFVRAVMIGREGLHREVLLDLFRDAGAANPVSYTSTGNVSFEHDRVGAVTKGVEADLERLLGRPTPLFVRSVDELQAMLDTDPFATAPFDHIRARLITFFRESVPPPIEPPIDAPNGDWSVLAASRRELFSVTRAWPDRQPNDPGGAIQRIAGEPVTTRALGTVQRIVTKLT